MRILYKLQNCISNQSQETEVKKPCFSIQAIRWCFALASANLWTWWQMTKNLLLPLCAESTDKRSLSYNSTFCSPPYHNGSFTPYKVISIKSDCLQISNLIHNNLFLHLCGTGDFCASPFMGAWEKNWACYIQLCSTKKSWAFSVLQGHTACKVTYSEATTMVTCQMSG